MTSCHLSCDYEFSDVAIWHYWLIIQFCSHQVPWFTFAFDKCTDLSICPILFYCYINVSNFPRFNVIFSGFWICRQNWSSLRYQPWPATEWYRVQIRCGRWAFEFQEDVNGVNRLATKGEKYYWLPTKRVKNNRLPTGKILTDYRHGLTLSIFVFRKKSILHYFLAVRK